MVDTNVEVYKFFKMNSCADEKVLMLSSMGFDEAKAKQALSHCNGNIDLAVDIILSGQLSTATTATSISQQPGRTSNNDTVDIVQTDVSQYSFENGRSACTCIALHTASTVLQKLKNNIEKSTENPKEWITPGFLQSLLISGVDLYNKADSSVEHRSPDEVLSSSVLSSALRVKLLTGGVRQGILTAGDGPLGLKESINECRASINNEWMAVVITKTPETICIFLPPKHSEYNSHPYIVIDSHPRPTFSADGCYALFHTSIDGMVDSLKKIFPAIDLGVDVGEVMAAMYNSFDLYPLQSS